MTLRTIDGEVEYEEGADCSLDVVVVEAGADLGRTSESVSLETGLL